MNSNIIRESFKRFMDDGFLIWNEDLDINIFLNILNQMHLDIKYTIESSETHNSKQFINFLDVTVTLDTSNKIETDIYYKPVNSHEYLNYHSHHPQHVKDNIPFNLAKRIIVFVSDYQRCQYRLQQLREWLKECNYPEKVIDKGFFNAKLQGPAPENKNRKIIPFVSTYYSNYSNQNIVNTAKELLSTSSNTNIQEIFNEHQIVFAQKQPSNLLRILSNSSITPRITAKGLFKCQDIRCKLCQLYIQEGDRFIMSNNQEWIIKCKITCRSVNVIYYLKCIYCNTSYIDKTNNFRLRMNNHISSCKSGMSDNIFDNHVFNCLVTDTEPLFKIYAMIRLNDVNKLLEYEHYFHQKGYDTMNRTI